MAGVGDLKRICTDAFFVAGAVQEASSAEMFGAQGADFLRGVAFWRIKSSATPRCFFVMDSCGHGSMKRWTGKKLTERSKWMDEWLDRQKDRQFNR